MKALSLLRAPLPRALVLAVTVAFTTCAAVRPARAAAADPPPVTSLGRGPVIVIVPDLGSGRLAWMPVARRLMDAHRVVLVELPGQGGSDLPEPFSYETAAAALEPVLAPLPAESTIVVGHGAGAVIAAHAARAHPERLRGLALVDMPAKFPIPVPDAQRKMFVQWMGEHYDELIARIFQPQGADTAHGDALLAAANLVPRATMTAYLRQFLDLDAAATLGSFRKPVLYVGSELRWPAERPWTEVAAERGLARPGVEAQRVSGCGRWIMKDRPDSLATAIASFVEQMLAAESTAER